MWDISNGNSMPPHHLDWNTDDRDKMADPIIADHRSYTTNEDLTSMDDADDGTWNHVQSNVINPPLPLTPTVANEVPLSLAIMVDGDDDDPHHVGTVLQHRTTLPPDSYRSKSDEAAFVDNYANSVDVNHGENSDHHDIYHNVQPLHRNYADMARTLQTKRPDLHRYSSSSSSSSSSSKHYDYNKKDCDDQCSSTGIIIFFTTLIVTIVHLTLATTVYLYLNKLKRSNMNRQMKIYNPNNINSRLNSLSSSTSSTISGMASSDDDLSTGTIHGPSSYQYDGGMMVASSQHAHQNSNAINLAAQLREFLWFNILKQPSKSNVAFS
ncbi:hypothetical protein BLOT_002435 [Blomia tropicalis]|nr:hypothetical protein BLOT_002435 [Blomia tropicalis]